jgi:hypothetical protein
VLLNQIRGLLAEYRMVISQGVAKVRRVLPAILASAGNGLTWDAREWREALAAELHTVDQWRTETECKMQ